MDANTQQQYISWYEKYRPRSIEELIFPNTINGENKGAQYIENIMKKFYDEEFIRGNILSYGDAGFGKTGLTKIFQGKIIKHPNDIFILDRKVESVDKLKVWLNQSTVKSRQKLVVIEEIDRLSNQAQTVLKDDPLEKYQDRVAFLATTNNPQKLDPALVTRFNYRLYFNELDEEKTIKRMAWILGMEKVQYNHNDLVNFVKIYIKRGLRELISSLEINSVTGVFVFDINKALNTSGNEKYIIDTTKYLIAYLRTLQKDKSSLIMQNTKNDEHFYQYYYYMTKILKEDLLLNYDYIYKELIEDETIDFGSKNILIEDYQTIDIVKMKNFQFLASFSKIMDLIEKSKNL